MRIKPFSYTGGCIPSQKMGNKQTAGVKKNTLKNKENIGPPPDYPAPPPPEQSAQKTNHFVKGIRRQLEGKPLPDGSPSSGKRIVLGNRVTTNPKKSIDAKTPQRAIVNVQTRPTNPKRLAGRLVRNGVQASFVGAGGHKLFTNQQMTSVRAVPTRTAAEARSSSGKAQFAKQIVEELISSSIQDEGRAAFSLSAGTPFGRSTALSESTASAMKQLPETASKEELSFAINTSLLGATEKLALAKKLTAKTGAPINPENTVKLEKLFTGWSESYLENKNTPGTSDIPTAIQDELQKNKETKLKGWKEAIASLSETDKEFLQEVLTLHENITDINEQTQPSTMSEYKEHLGISMMLQPLLLSGTAVRNQRAAAMEKLSDQIKLLGPGKGEKDLQTQVEDLKQELKQVQAKMKKRFANKKKSQNTQGEIEGRISDLERRMDDITALEQQIREIQKESKVAGFAQNGAMVFLAANWDEINSN